SVGFRRRNSASEPPQEHEGRARPHRCLRRHQPRPEAPRLPLRGIDHRLRLHAGGGHGERPSGDLLPTRPACECYTPKKMKTHNIPPRSLAALALLGLACIPLTGARAQQAAPSGAVMLVAAPRLVDPDYRSTVLLAVPVENNRHVGVIINRPTGRSLSSLFPEHAPSKMVKDPVYFGGPMLRQAVFAVVHIDHTPGPGSIQMMKELFL